MEWQKRIYGSHTLFAYTLKASPYNWQIAMNLEIEGKPQSELASYISVISLGSSGASKCSDQFSITGKSTWLH